MLIVTPDEDDAAIDEIARVIVNHGA